MSALGCLQGFGTAANSLSFLPTSLSETFSVNCSSSAPALDASRRGNRPFAVKAHLEEATREDEAKKSSFSRLRVAGAAAMAALAILQSGDVALAYKGGGPYGIGVTRGQDLSAKDFSGLDLTKQDFKTSILRQANFKGAKLLGASFFDADLTGADFSDSDLRGADFSLASAKGADFTNANLEGALVTGNTSFKGSIITGADFTDVYFRDDQRKELCQIAKGTNPLTGNDTRETLFCS
eukprot:TRINITY_DN3427_c0_g1_i1.p1 TRINITY_DN3427_c0_g1~~TRINITY_DN3427_c0_g1_i1.p1  ORF type:complete len:238 (-),score=50.85 TRINITY_DN3427_c0_g1_i1:214-927(-)